MLDDYLQQTRRLLQNPPAPTQLYTTADLTAFINQARKQIAGDSESIRAEGDLALSLSTRTYDFADIDVGVEATTGIEGVLHVRQGRVSVADGWITLYTRPFPWFEQYLLNEVIPSSGVPETWSQYGQGQAGSLYVYPLPDTTYSVRLDTICVPSDLVTDDTVEAIPYPWTNCVQFFAAYYAYMSAQRQSDAEQMLKRYGEYRDRARKMANPSVLASQYPQTTDPTRLNKLGMNPGGVR